MISTETKKEEKKVSCFKAKEVKIQSGFPREMLKKTSFFPTKTAYTYVCKSMQR